MLKASTLQTIAVNALQPVNILACVVDRAIANDGSVRLSVRLTREVRLNGQDIEAHFATCDRAMFLVS